MPTQSEQQQDSASRLTQRMGYILGACAGFRAAGGLRRMKKLLEAQGQLR